MYNFIKNINHSPYFEKFIFLIIIINCTLIGVETYYTSSAISITQNICLVIFIFEILIRSISSPSFKLYIKDGWNLFDLTIVILSIIPESLIANSTGVTALRVLRVFRILRLIKTNEEIRLIVTVLSRSVRSLFYNIIFFLIFLYLFAIIGIELFRLPKYEDLPELDKIPYTQYISSAPNAPDISPDPYGSLSETMFTLFRILTGEDWTDIRYNLIEARNYGLINVSSTIITSYHVIWYILSAFLLLNLIVGAILVNYQTEMDKKKKDEMDI